MVARFEPEPTRPLLKWFGGKWNLAPWIISHFPQHHTYVEPFGGAASVLLRKPRSLIEVYNDLDDNLVNVLRILRDERLASKLIEVCRLTPFSRVEYLESLKISSNDPVERARQYIFKSFAEFGSVGIGFRAVGASNYAKAWAGYPDALKAIIDRVGGVTIEHRPALEVLRQQDDVETLFYLDPPYLPQTRKGGRYVHDLTEKDHYLLLEDLKELSGMVVLSGYPSEEYDRRQPGWHRVQTTTTAGDNIGRVEVLWLNPSCTKRLEGNLLLPYSGGLTSSYEPGK